MHVPQRRGHAGADPGRVAPGLHTWPEESLIAIDLFSCGAIDGDTVVAQLVGELGLTGVRAQQMDRGTVR